MEPTETERPLDPMLASLVESAKGWHRIQLAALGFIGLCGVLWTSGDPAGPRWLQWLAAALIVVSLVLAGLAIYLVGRVAYPLQGAAGGQSPAVADGARRLRTGIRTTFAAIAVLAVGTMSGWWPEPAAGGAGGGAVEVRDVSGRAWCGELVDGPAGAIQIETEGDTVPVPLGSITSLRPVDGCGN